MSLKTAIRTNTFLKTTAQKVEKIARRGVTFLITKYLRKNRAVEVESLHGPLKILLVRPNYRIGNALIMSPIIETFRQRFPDAQIDLLTTDNTRTLFRHQGVDHVLTLSRDAIVRPWRFPAMLRRLRREQYDLAVQAGPSSLTGLIFVRCIKSRYTMGKGKRDQRWFDIEVSGDQRHAYDMPQMFARALDTSCRDRPLMLLSSGERSIGRGELEELGIDFDDAGRAAPFVALFVGGHLDKRLPLSFWQESIDALESAGQRYVVFVGPEELRHAPALEQQMADSRYGALCRPRPLRIFAAMLHHARHLISPDSGPLHIGAALDVPVMALVQKRKSLKFAPRGPLDIVLWQPDAGRLLEAVTRPEQFQGRRDIEAVVPDPTPEMALTS
ncbi:glycosyltransferase family 9 protein [Kushneria indalinina]|uniref:Heptosyltransferase-3 n=1 Tax=Kushneria indalinina DSM 14324 TaxID=1122140 RepID=A0A3D9DWL5_9GAMM|nr:glycosyltransferase family 9 protein [Kushneria indalinina]REC95157.1 heptosyltransferase-3 [Kushneria indalinina DSM 14324]